VNYQIARYGEATQKIKNSKFITRVFPVESRESVQTIVQDIRREHPKATHICWAFRLVEQGEARGYSNDGGEPAGSAGSPILAALEGRQLVNTLCVIIRYFGGIKLGIGGLIRAYGGAAAEVLTLTGRKSVESMLLVKIRLGQENYSEVMRILRKYRLAVQSVYQRELVQIEFKIAAAKFAELAQTLKAVHNIEVVSS
jgi:uncharacterized YigZ family protein